MRPDHGASNRVADGLGHLLSDAFAAYHDSFRDITTRAQGHFERRDWGRAQADATGRLALYRVRVEQAVSDTRARLGQDIAADPALWAAAKSRFAVHTCDRPDAEIAQTFFNSVVRRVRGTVGSDPATEFSGASLISANCEATCTTLDATRLDTDVIARMLRLFTWSVPYADLAGDARTAAAIAGFGQRPIQGLDVLCSVFYRNKGAYVVGRVRHAGGVTPLILALSNGPQGITIDAALPTADEASVVFGFSWSYFHVDIDRPGALVAFLSSLMPFRRVDELYTAVGYHRHGKTVFYHHLMQHLQHPDARFEVAEGEEGTVMSVFTLPSFNVVFKVIKDAFGPTKTTTRRGVMDRYQFVFVRDRVGRLADAQEFESLEFPVDRFSAELLTHLLSDCARTVRVDRDRVVIQHAYTERRVTPLNLFLKHADPAAARDAVLDYGNAIKDLAGADIFTGDMLLKNFGVTRHGRVICYDYDELALLNDCHIRRIPPPADNDEEMSAEPYFYVAPHDVFPEEFRSFLVPPGALRDAFLSAHADLLDVEYWREVQAKVRAGEVLDVFPYRPTRRLAQSR
ncbi:MAG TPA: bifunctional isocitrate dehydrogenase kinase/phosphatase [Gemmatimonadaceae bacterium]|nr:bifunctional isocitrate dehydrogenase kinase/phosphatase [Gemmatimonadaceae bacterium]